MTYINCRIVRIPETSGKGREKFLLEGSSSRSGGGKNYGAEKEKAGGSATLGRGGKGERYGRCCMGASRKEGACATGKENWETS